MEANAGSIVAVAMTTAPRREPTFHRAMASLLQAGFHVPVHVFAEPGTWEQVDRPHDKWTHVHDHEKTLGCFNNWKTSLTYLLERTTAPWLLVVQDDALWAPNAAKSLLAEAVSRQGVRTGFLSPYVTSYDVPAGACDGWNECRSGWELYGALALCIPRRSADKLLRHESFVQHRSNQQVDAIVAKSMLELERPSYVHVPSLVDHIGMTSTLGHDNVSPGLRGYRFGEHA